jgi:hypothetical protein
MCGCDGWPRERWADGRARPPRGESLPPQTKTPETLRSLALHIEDRAVLAGAAGSLALLCCRPPTCVGCWPSSSAFGALASGLRRWFRVLQPHLDADLRLASVASLPALPFEPQPSNSRRRCVLSLALAPPLRLAPAANPLSSAFEARPPVCTGFRASPASPYCRLRTCALRRPSGSAYQPRPTACTVCRVLRPSLCCGPPTRVDCQPSSSASEPQLPTFIFESALRRSFQTGPPTLVGALAFPALPSSNRPPTLRRLLCPPAWPSC